MHESDYEDVEGLVSADLFQDLYETLIRLCFLEGDGLLMNEETDMLDGILDLVHTHNPSWMDVVLGEPDDGDDCFDDGFSNPEEN